MLWNGIELVCSGVRQKFRVTGPAKTYVAGVGRLGIRTFTFFTPCDPRPANRVSRVIYPLHTLHVGIRVC